MNIRTNIKRALAAGLLALTLSLSLIQQSGAAVRPNGSSKSEYVSGGKDGGETHGRRDGGGGGETHGKG